MKGGGSALRYVLGTVVVVPLLLYLISIIFFSPRKVTDKQIDKYIIADSVNVTTHLAKRTVYDALNRDKEKVGPDFKRIIMLIKRSNNVYLHYQTYLFYEKDYKKYFILISFDTDVFIFGIDGQNVVMTVNKDDLNNPVLGTIDNPVPVLKFWGADKSLREDNKDYNKAWMDNDYRGNVQTYLEYLMPKKEFKARFGK